MGARSPFPASLERMTMRRPGPGPDDMPMPPERFAELVRSRQGQPAPDPLQSVPSREPAGASSDLAAELLAESAHRILESGELLLVSEEASLADLEAAAAAVPAAASLPLPAAEDPMLVALAEPRLLCPRLYEVAGWQPPLPEHLRMLEGALRAGLAVGQTMLVGHVETLPERVEHVVRLRELRDAARLAVPTASILVAVQTATAAQIPGDPGRAPAVAESARPGDPDADRRHAEALARLALGPQAVVA